MDNTENKEAEIMLKQVPDYILLGLLNVHSVYSMKESTQSIKKIVERAKELKCPAIALTDNGNMFGMYDFYYECIENGIKPILGVKTHVDYGVSDSRTIVLLAKNMDGLQAIFKAVTESNSKNGGKGHLFLMKKETLVSNFGNGAKGHDNVIATSGCVNGIIAGTYSIKGISGNEADEIATNDALWYQKVFGKKNFFIELQYHGMPEEEFIMRKLIQVAKKNSLPTVLTNEPYMPIASTDENLAMAILRTQTTKEWVDPGTQDKERYIKSDKEMVEKLREILEPQDILNGYRGIKTIVANCNIKIPTQKHYPTAHVPEGYDSKTYLEKLVQDGLVKRYGVVHDEKYDKRAKYELSVIDKLNVNDYFLIVRDICEFGRLVAKLDLDNPEEVEIARTFNKELIQEKVKERLGEGIGHARGSAGGSIVSYTVGITNIEPVDNGLYFSRFLSPNRVTMPDIDIDVETKARTYCIEYMKHKYGEKCVAGITTFVKCAGRKALGVTAKALSYKLGRKSTAYDELARAIADKAEEIAGDKEIDLSRAYNGKSTLEHKLLELYKDTDHADFIIHGARLIQGSVVAKSQHAGGLILTDGTPLEDLIPLVWNDTNKIMTIQCDMVNAEKNGLLKIDVLGLNTLTIISETEKYIKERHGVTISLTNIPFSEDVMKNVFHSGNTDTVFQMESDEMKQLNKKFKPNDLKDLAIENAMYRPGPMQFMDDIIKVRNGAKPEYLCKELEPILSETYGAIIYQEQIMRITRDLAGFSEARADDCRRAMSKKKQAVLEGMRQAFVYGDEEAKGCIANGIAEDIADKIFEKMLKFAKYALNKAHATAYALMAYQTAWLKWNYPLEWMCANINGSETEKYKGYFADLKNRGTKILLPDVNASDVEFSIEKDALRFGLSKIKGIGVSTKHIVEERRNQGEYKSLSDFIVRVTPDKKTLETLISSGALDALCKNRKALMVIATELLTVSKTLRAEKLALEAALNERNRLMADKCKDAIMEITSKAEALVPDVKILEDEREKLETEKEFLFEYISAHPMDRYEDPTCSKLIDLKALGNWKDTTVCALISEANVVQRKKDGAEMAQLTISDKTASVKVWCYANEYKNLSKVLKKDAVLKMKVQMRFSNGRRSYVMLSAEEKVLDEKAETLTIEIENIAEWYYGLQNAIKPYIDKNGNKCMVYDKSLEEIRECEYRINPCILESKRFKVSTKK